jgi:serpin B
MVISCSKSFDLIDDDHTGYDQNNITSSNSHDGSGNNSGNGTSSPAENMEPPEKTDIGLVKNNNGFAFMLFAELIKEDREQNIFISPLSVSAALTMAYNGASGQTAADMSCALNFGDLTLAEINEGFKMLLSGIRNPDDEIELSIANSIWTSEDFVVKQDFLDRNHEVFSAEISSLDFNKPDAPDIINSWIEDNTNGKIEKMIDSIDRDVLMYLINAIYFKGFWTSQFDEEMTEVKDFHLPDGSTVKVPMMHQKAEFYHKSLDDFALLKLPYGKNLESAMYIMLPEKAENIDELISSIDFRSWEEITRDLEKKEVSTWIPRFKTEYGIKNLNHALTSLGMGTAFSHNADFSGIGQDIFISRVLHKALIEVNEKGSEAAAATVVEMKRTAFEETPEFNASRPFFFVIADEKTGSIMFMGKLQNPSLF